MLNSIHVLSIYIPEREKYFNLMFGRVKRRGRNGWIFGEVSKGGELLRTNLRVYGGSMNHSQLQIKSLGHDCREKDGVKIFYDSRNRASVVI